jgi:hypothetical protein
MQSDAVIQTISQTIELGAEMVVKESINADVLQWGTRQGNVPLSNDESCGRK